MEASIRWREKLGAYHWITRSSDHREWSTQRIRKTIHPALHTPGENMPSTLEIASHLCHLLLDAFLQEATIYARCLWIGSIYFPNHSRRFYLISSSFSSTMLWCIPRLLFSAYRFVVYIFTKFFVSDVNLHKAADVNVSKSFNDHLSRLDFCDIDHFLCIRWGVSYIFESRRAHLGCC